LLIRSLTTLVAVLSLLAPLVAEADPPPAGVAPQQGVRKRDLSEERPRWVEGQVLVRFKEDVRRAQAKEVHRALGAEVEDRIKPFDIEVVDLPPDVSVPEAVAAYEADPRVAEVSPNLIRRPFGVPNDLLFEDQWGHDNDGQLHPIGDGAFERAGTALADADSDLAWDEQTGDTSTVIAVLDTGVDVTHADLSPNLWVNPGEIANGVDDDDNGYIDDVNGCDFTDDNCQVLMDAPANDSRSHGTHVAGIAAARSGNSMGVAGACPQCSIMVLKITGPGGNFPLDAEIEALAYVRQMKADLPGTRFIVNASFGGDIWLGMERRAIELLGDDDILFVAAAGNAALDNDMALAGFSGFSPSFPASFDLPNILSVAASNHKDQYGYGTGCNDSVDGLGQSRSACLFTSWGRRSVDLAAPGVDIVSTLPGSGYEAWNGTSMAAPFAAGVAGLVWSEHTEYSALEVKNAVMNGAEHPPNLDDLPFEGRVRTGKFTQTSDGRIDAAKALAGDPSDGPGGHDGTISGAKKIKRKVEGRVAWPNDVNDVYKKRLKRGRYRIALRGGADNDFDLYIWKPGTTEIWQFEESCFVRRGSCKLLKQRTSDSGNEKFRSLRIRVRGLHYIHVTAFLFEKGRYKLRVKRLS
jgi:subtilisin family serine protease